MAEASDALGILYQNLLDAGCTDKMIKTCIARAKNEKWNTMLPLLIKHRKFLLEQVHIHQQQIDCLDFLIHKINKDYI